MTDQDHDIDPRPDAGATMVEHALLCTFIGLVCVLSLALIGPTVAGFFNVTF